MEKKTRSPWAWIPTLYLAEGLPYVAVMTISVIMYKRMGISNTDIALYTSWLYLPWVIKPLWSPFIDLLKTKRWWIFVMQLLIGAGMAGIAFTIPMPFFFQATLCFFWLMAFSSATHDIAADGFYMLALNSNDQAKYVGIRSTFYRVSTIMGQGVLIILAGFLEGVTGVEPAKIEIEVSPQYTQSTMMIPNVGDISEQEGEIHFITAAETLKVGTQGLDKDSLKTFLKNVAVLNAENGFIHKEDLEKDTPTGEKKDGWWTANVSKPLGGWIKRNFGEHREVAELDHAGNVIVTAVWLSKKPETGKEMVLNTTMDRGDKSISLIHGDRLAFTEKNWNKPAYMVFQVDPKLTTASTVEYKGLSGNIPFAWSITFFVLAGLFVFFSFYHKVMLPKPDSDKPAAEHVTSKTILKDFVDTFRTFFKKPQIGIAIFFMLTFRFSEAQALKLINPFLLDSRDIGGLGLTTGEVGLVYGTIGIIGLTLGGIIGGYAASRGGLKKWLWPMTMSMLITIATFVYLSFSQTESLILINICIFIEQFGYGFGFTAYMLYLMYFSEGEQKTAHYAICTGFMALGMMIPGMFAGWLQEQLGYNHFFIWVMICCIVPIVAVALLKIDPNYGKAEKDKEKETIEE
ncbi:MFS transporter [Dysgonomonas sp. 520]|uniref:MFS transporter n=1 Tax=Dysgonomonas sp. 520 TaxID=2302931 RepID=UPI0013D237B7|nr:MFS transporter [Dysgonomonas sp. 520]NDW10364.1 MFS transporter [Dysgonomonas sp. 520]